MGARSDKILGRAKQALGAVTADNKMKRRGQLQEDKGELKGKLDSSVDRTQDVLDDLKKTINRT